MTSWNDILRELRRGFASDSTRKRIMSVLVFASLIFSNFHIATPASAVTCGDSVIEGAEQCDDGNTANGDGCSSSCLISVSGYGSSTAIVIDDSAISETLTNFPVLISDDSFISTVYANTESDGKDLLFTSDAGGNTPLAFEIVEWDTGNSTSQVWVKMPSISSSADTTFYVWYDNSSAIAPAAAADNGGDNVWTNSFASVWHLEEETGAGAYLDDSAGNYDATPVSANWVDAQVGYGREITTNGYLTVASPSFAASYSLGTWFYAPLAATTWKTMFRGPASVYKHPIIVDANGLLGYYDTGGSNFVSSGFDTDSLSTGWHHIRTTSTGGSTIFYVDGQNVGSVAKQSSGGLYAIGNYEAGGQSFGKIDEVRMDDVARSSGWVEAEYNNQGDQIGFYLVCGDGVIETGEQCDDGNSSAGDGCSVTCQTEQNWETDFTLDFDLADEGQFLQESASIGTDFGTGTVALKLNQYSAKALSGGTGGLGGSYVYTAPDGTVVTSSAPVYSNPPYYYMSYLFNQSYTGSEYWLTNSSGTRTLSFDFPSSLDEGFIRVYPWTRTDAWSAYQIEVSSNGVDYTNITDGFTHGSIGSSGDKFDYNVGQSYADVRFTLTRQGGWGVTLNEIEFYEPVESGGTLSRYSADVGYYVTTSDQNQLDTSSWTKLGTVNIDESTPIGTSVKYLVSFDGRTTWKYWDGNSWEVSALSAIDTNGMTSSAVEALLRADWEFTGGFVASTTQTLDIAMDLKTTDSSVTPSVDRISVTYEVAAGGGGGGESTVPDEVEVSGALPPVEGGNPSTVTALSLNPDISDGDGVKQVQLLIDGTLMHTCVYDSPYPTAPSCAYSLGTMPRGTYTLTTRVTDSNDVVTDTDATLTVAGFTVENEVIASRNAAGATGVDFRIEFELAGTSGASEDLIIEFPPGFNVVSVGTSALTHNCVTGLTRTDSDTVSATKNSCPGSTTITVAGMVVDLPSQSGEYIITWSNDYGGAPFYLNDSDQVNVSSNVDPSISFNVGTAALGAVCDSTFTGNGGVVALGTLDTGTISGSDSNSVNHICTRMSHNATHGAVITVRSLYAELRSLSTPADMIPAVGTVLSAGTEGYGICVGSESAHFGNDPAADPLADDPNFTGSDFATANCTSSVHQVGLLATSAKLLWMTETPTENAFVRVFLKASISSLTEAHDDYTDTLTFIMTATY